MKPIINPEYTNLSGADIIQYKQKKRPSCEGLGGGEPAWNYFQTGGRVLFLFFRPNLMTDPHSK